MQNGDEGEESGVAPCQPGQTELFCGCGVCDGPETCNNCPEDCQ